MNTKDNIYLVVESNNNEFELRKFFFGSITRKFGFLFLIIFIFVLITLGAVYYMENFALIYISNFCFLEICVTFTHIN